MDIFGGGCQDDKWVLGVLWHHEDGTDCQQVDLAKGGLNIAGERCQGSDLRQDKKECLKGRIFWGGIQSIWQPTGCVLSRERINANTRILKTRVGCPTIPLTKTGLCGEGASIVRTTGFIWGILRIKLYTDHGSLDCKKPTHSNLCK